MATAAWPTVVTAVAATISAAVTNATVVRGRDFSGATGDVVMVGIDSMDDSEWDSPGSFDQEFQTFGSQRLETGTVNGVAFSRNGGSDQGAATEAAIALIAGLATAIRSTPSLGITTFDYVVAELQTGEIQESQNEEGAVSAVAFVVAYQARI